MATQLEPSTTEQLAIQMADWVDENVTGLSQREAEGLEAEFKRLVALIRPNPESPAPPASAIAATLNS
jgi:hypothetical protein